jgi:hypothetical protein
LECEIEIIIESESEHTQNSDYYLFPRYVQYSEIFELKDGKLTSKDIDDVYCLTNVMPGCFLHLAVREFKHDEQHVRGM